MNARAREADITTTASSSPDRWTRRDAYVLLFLVGVAAASSLPFFYTAGGNMPEAHDLRIHWIRMIAFDENLRSGDFYPRWLGSLNHGYGAATTLFYAPGIYFALSAAHALTGDWVRAIEIVVWVSAAASALSFYLFARQLVSRRAAAFGAVLYLLLPYRLIDLYHRGALAELLAFVWMPLVLYSLTVTGRHGRPLRIVIGGWAFSLLVLSHPPTAYLFAGSVIVYAAAACWRLREWKPGADCCVVLLLGIALSAFYSVPAVLELNYVKQSVTSTFEEHPGYLTTLLTGNRFEQMIAAMSICTFLLILIAWMMARRNRSADRQNDAASIAGHGFAITSLAGLLLLTPLAGLLVTWVPGLSGTAFLWRWLAVQVVAAAGLGAVAFDSIGQRTARGRLRMALMSVSAVLVLFGIAAAGYASNIRLRFEPPERALEEAFTPGSAPSVFALEPRDPVTVRPTSLSGQATIVEWEPERRVIDVEAYESATLEVRTFAFPGWMARIDEHPAATRADADEQTILIDLAPGMHRVELVFSDTPARSITRLISLCILVASMMYFTLCLLAVVYRRP